MSPTVESWLRTLHEYVLLDAIVRFQTTRYHTRPRLRSEHEELVSWFTARETESPFSFLNICSSFRLDPDAVWRAISTDGAIAMLRIHHRTKSKEVTLAERYE